MKKLFSLIIFLIMGISAFSQGTQPEFSIPVGNFLKKATFIKQSDIGTIIIGTGNSLVGIDPVKKEKAWEFSDLLNIEEKDFQVIEGTPYVLLEIQNPIAIAKNKKLIIFNSYDGKIVYDSKDEGIKVRNTRIMPELNGLLIEGVKEDEYFIALLDFNTSTITWKKEFGKVKTGFGIGALKSAIMSHLQSIFNIQPVVDASGNFIFSSKETTYCLDGKTGAELWTKVYKHSVTDFILSPDKKDIYIVYNNKLEKLETQTGKAYYDKPVEFDGEVNGFMPIENNANVVMHSAGFNILEGDGSLRWKKDVRLGNTTQVFQIADGYIAVEHVEKEKDSKIYKITSDGKKKWDEGLSQPIVTVQPINNGVLYITTERANILDYEKGKDVWKRDIKIKGKPTFGFDDNKGIVYVYSNNTLSGFNLGDGTFKEITPELKLKEFDDSKDAAEIEPRGDNIFLHTEQNMAMLKGDGTVLYNKYFTEAGMSKGTRRLLKGIAIATEVVGTGYAVAGMGDMKSWRVKGQYKDANTGQTVTEITSNQMETGAAIANTGAALNSFAEKRHRATFASKTTMYILSKWDQGTGLVIVDKDSGNEIKRIVFNDKDPKYVVDEAASRIYVLVNEKDLVAYNMN